MEILFRGRCKANGLWYKGFLYKDRFIIDDGDGEEYAHGRYSDKVDKVWIDTMMYCVDPETVGQYINKIDANGKLIFTGDILVDADEDKFDPFLKKPIVIYYDSCSFMYREIDDKYGFSIDDNEFGVCINNFKVIGNIHDNPELLEVSHE